LLDSCSSNISKITNKVSNCIEYSDFKILKIIITNNIVKLDSSILYNCILLLQILKKQLQK